MHMEVSKVQVTGSQDSVPPAYPSPVQSNPPRFAPSHCSDGSICPLPQVPPPEVLLVDVEVLVEEPDDPVPEEPPLDDPVAPPLAMPLDAPLLDPEAIPLEAPESLSVPLAEPPLMELPPENPEGSSTDSSHAGRSRRPRAQRMERERIIARIFPWRGFARQGGGGVTFRAGRVWNAVSCRAAAVGSGT